MTEAVSVRPVGPADMSAIAGIGNAAWPDFSVTAQDIEARDVRRSATHCLRRRVAVRGSQIVGWSLAESDPRGMRHGSVQVWGAVLPAAHGTGVGHALYAELMQALLEGEAPTVLIEVREHHAAARAFFEARGFSTVLRYAVSCLALAHFDPTPHAERLAQVAQSGVHIVTARQMRATRPDAIARINALRWAIAQDVPAADAPVRESDDALAAYLDHHPTALPDGWLIAQVDTGLGDVAIGLTSVWRSRADPTVIQTGVTGVLPAWRRRGVALALKMGAIAYARSIGGRRLFTDNEESNPMYLLNLKLGFEPQPAWLAYRRALSASCGSNAAK
ncbi:MAG: mycothiol synthase [Bradymonadia bacterium]|jgi:mycothiol synthase